jgi:hypothetical protein
MRIGGLLPEHPLCRLNRRLGNLPILLTPRDPVNPSSDFRHRDPFQRRLTVPDGPGR